MPGLEQKHYKEQLYVKYYQYQLVKFKYNLFSNI